MTYKTKVAACSELCTKPSTQSEHHVEFLHMKPGFERLNMQCNHLLAICLYGVLNTDSRDMTLASIRKFNRQHHKSVHYTGNWGRY